MSIYTISRSTQDFDFVVDLKEQDLQKFTAFFSEGYYCDYDAMSDALIRKGLFNIIDHATGFKADFIILKDEAYRQLEFSRRCKVTLLGKEVYIVSGEDLLLSKLIWIQELQSGRQKEDIHSIAKYPELDWNYIWHWIKKLNLSTFDLTLPHAGHA